MGSYPQKNYNAARTHLIRRFELQRVEVPLFGLKDRISDSKDASRG